MNSFNEWDPLEEVIVGVADNAVFPPWHWVLETTMPESSFELFKKYGGKPFPAEIIDEAKRELDILQGILEKEGVIVRRPERLEYAKGFSTPDWSSESGLYAAMPRDVLLVVGDEIIEAPMAWRCRYFEPHAYRPLIAEYFRKGARWTAAPKPMLRDDQYNFDDAVKQGAPHFAVTEVEPTFDAADFARCGRDIFVQRSHVTNAFGIEWLRRHLGPDYRIHELDVNDAHPMHIDATFVPMAAGKLLANPERFPQAPAMFKDWEMRFAPPPNASGHRTLYMTSAWISMNLLSIDEKRVLIESQEPELKAFLKAWGFEPIPCPFRHFNAIGGSFHCATADIRRTGTLQSYF